jgi:hypothetical protein
MGIIRKKRITKKITKRITNEISNSKDYSIQYGSAIKGYKPQVIARKDAPKKTADQQFGKKPNFFKRAGTTIWHAPKKAYAAIGAIKNTAKYGLGTLAYKITGRTRQGALDKKRELGEAQFTKKFGNTTDSSGTKLSNPFVLAKTISESRKAIEDIQKRIDSTPKNADQETVKQLHIDMEGHREKIATADSEKAKLIAHAGTTTDKKQQKRLFTALQSIDKYNSKASQISEGWRGVAKRSYKNTKSSLEQEGVAKTLGSSILKTFSTKSMRNTLGSLYQGKGMQAASIATSGLGRSIGRSIANKVPFFRKKSIKTLTSRLTKDTADIQKVRSDSKKVLTNIENMSKDLDALKTIDGKPLTDSVSILKRESLNRQISEQKLLLGALNTKGDRMKALVNTTKKQLEAKTGRKDLNINKYITQSQEKTGKFLGSINSIRKTLTDPKDPNAVKFANVEALLTKFKDGDSTDGIRKDITNQEVANAYKDLSTMINGIQEKIDDPKTSALERAELKGYKKTVIEQGTDIRKLLKRTTKTDNTKILADQAEKIGKLVGRNTRSSTSAIQTGYTSSPNKYALNAALAKYKNVSAKPTVVPDNLKTLFSTDKGKVLESVYLTNPKKFDEFLKTVKPNATDEEKLEHVKAKYSEDIKYRATTSGQEITRIKGNIEKVNQEIEKLKTTNIARIESNINKLQTEQNVFSEKIKTEFLEPIKTSESQIAESKEKVKKFTEEVETHRLNFTKNTKILEENYNKMADIRIQISKANINGTNTTELNKNLKNLQLEHNNIMEKGAETYKQYENSKNQITTENELVKNQQDKISVLKQQQGANPDYQNYKKIQTDIDKLKTEGLTKLDILTIRQEKLALLKKLQTERMERDAELTTKLLTSTIS